MTDAQWIGYGLAATFWLWMAVTGVAAFVAGEREERRIFLVLFVASLGSGLVRALIGDDYEAVRVGVLAIDLALIGVLAVAVARSTRFFPMWTLAFHLAGVVSHFAKMASPQIPAFAYALGEGFWAYPIFATIFLGIYEVRLLRTLGRSA